MMHGQKNTKFVTLSQAYFYFTWVTNEMQF